MTAAANADVDRRVTCQACKHYRPHRCGNHVRAQLRHPDVSRAMAALPQWCGGFEKKA